MMRWSWEKTGLIGLFFIFFLNPVSGERYPFHQYLVLDGLPQAQVNVVYQSADGYLWVGTFDGLARFDGVSFTSFYSANGLSQNTISAVAEDDLYLYFGHFNGSISVYSKPLQKFIRTIEVSRDRPWLSLPLFRDQAGRIWTIVEKDSVIYIQNHQVKKISLHYYFGQPLPEDFRINAYQQGPDGWLYAATNYGVCSFHPDQRGSGWLDPRMKGNVRRIFLDHRNFLWIVYDYPLIERAEATLPLSGIQSISFKDYPEVEVISMYQDAEEYLWIGTLNHGLFRIAPEDVIKNPIPVDLQLGDHNGFTNIRVLSILQDDEGNHWFGTSGGGLFKLSSLRFVLYTKNDGLLGDAAFSVEEDHHGRLWVSTNNGISVFKNSKNGLLGKPEFSISDVEGKFGNLVSRIYRDKNNLIWLGTNGNGLFRVNPENYRFIHLSPQELGSPTVYDILSLDREKILLGTYGSGLKLLNTRTLEIITVSDKVRYIFSLFRDRNGHIWVGSNGNGVAVFDSTLHLVRTISEINGEPLFTATAFEDDSLGNIWIGTGNQGVIRFDGQNFYQYSRKSGLKGDFIFSLKICGPFLYAGHSGGVSRIQLGNYEIYNFDKDDGFLGEENNLHGMYLDRYGNLWLSGVRGLTRMENPAQEMINASSFKHLYIEKVRNAEYDLDIRNGDRISHRMNKISFFVRGIFFRKPTMVKYSYKLSPVDASWSPLTQQNEIILNYLPPGNYRFHLRATVDDGKNWVVHPPFSFAIEAPFWLRWQFYVLLGTMLLILVPFLVEIRARRERKEKEALQQLVEARTRDLVQEKEKLTGLINQLQESEEKFKRLTESTNAGIFIYQEDRFVYANPAVSRITGYDTNEIVGMRFWELVHPEHREMVKERGLARQKGKRVPDNYIFQIIHKDGSPRWVDFSASEITFNGQPAGLGTAIDITSRVEALKEIQEASTSYRDLFEKSMDLIYIQDLDGKFIDVNQTVVKTYGYPKEFFIGKTPEDLVDSEKTDIHAVQEQLKLVARGLPQKFEFWAIKANGESFPKEVIVQKGKYFGKDVFIAVARDISERKKFEKEIQEEKERFARTFEAIGDAVFVLDPEGKIELMNPAAQVLSGKAFSEASGMPIDHLIVFTPWDSQKKEKISFPALLQWGNSILNNLDFSLRNSVGQEFLVQVRLTKIFVEERIGHVVLVIHDLTEKRRFEREMARAEKLEALGLLSSGIAHDFNNILSILSGNLQILQIKSRDSGLEKYIQRSMEALARISSLVNQLQTFSKGGAPVKKEIRIEKLLHEIPAFLLAGSSIRLKYDIAEDLFSCEADEDQLGRVIQNIVLNAKEALKGKGEIFIRARNGSAGDDHTKGGPGAQFIRIEIEDNGPGIPKDILTKIFDPFFTTKEKGSGLGLSTSYSIIRRHGGELKVESVEGKGAKFIIHLPATGKTSKPAERRQDEEAEKGEKDQAVHWNGSVLVMDDEEEIIGVIKEALEIKGLKVDFCHDGKEAIRMVRESYEKGTPYRLLIMDLTIPGGMGGRDAMAEIKKHYPDMKAIISSGYTNDDTMANFKTYGFVDIIRKPFTLDELYRVMGRHLDHFSQTDEHNRTES